MAPVPGIVPFQQANKNKMDIKFNSEVQDSANLTICWISKLLFSSFLNHVAVNHVAINPSSSSVVWYQEIFAKG